MLNEKIILTPQEILDKEFKVDARGYRPQEVDKFLDLVIRDYAEFISIIKKQDKEIAYLTDDNGKLKKEIRYLREKLESSGGEKESRNPNNVDLLRRLSQLEKAVYGKDE